MIYKLSFIACFVFLFTANAFVITKTRKIITFPKEAHEQIRAVAQKCAGNTDFSDLLKLVREGKYREDDYFKNFIHCSYKKSGYAFDNGRVMLEHAASIYPDPALMLTVLKKCDTQESTPVETTFQYFKCFQDNTPYLVSL